MIAFGAETCRRIDDALAREWLVTNGRGGYASSTITGTPTRRYHGLLVVAKRPPIDRHVLVAQVDELLTYDGRPYQISTTEYQNNTLSPAGYIHVAEFRLDRGLPVTRFEIGDASLEKRVWMAYGHDTAYVQYTWDAAAPSAAALVLRPLVSGRPFHALHAADPSRPPRVDVTGNGLSVSLAADLMPVRVELAGGTIDAQGDWYWRVQYRRDRERGHGFLEDLFMPGTLSITLAPGASAVLVLSSGAALGPAIDPAAAWQLEWRRRGELQARGAHRVDDELGRALAIAADAFVVRLPTPQAAGGPPAATELGHAIIGGYHWFSRAGREALIALPGLLLGSGRLAAARAVLTGLLTDQRDGLLPVRYDEVTGAPDYYSADTSLWLFVALRAYLDRSRDHGFLAAWWPTLVDVIEAYVRGTGAGIQVDPRDGLVRAGEPGRQLTWMDARAGDRAVTPRRGKPVELNALWYNATRQMADWAKVQAPDRVAEFHRLAEQTGGSFTQRFWYQTGWYLYDVVDTDAGNDASFRANQVLSIGLPYPVLERGRWRTVVDAVRAQLVTPGGVRTLTPMDPNYVGWYAGDAFHRDGAYHQGTAWPWLIGPYFDACQRVYPGNQSLAEQFEALARHLAMAGLGTISEMFDGDPPHSPQGAIASAAAVGEVLRVWRTLQAPD